MFWFMLILSMFKFPFLFNNATTFTINILFIYILNEPFNELLTYATNMHFACIDSNSAKYYTHVCETVQSHLRGGGGCTMQFALEQSLF